MTKPKRYKRYSAEFKREAILRASEEGVTDARGTAAHGARCKCWEIVATLN
jgi:transposase-like protein